jgi:hypothetical protein
MLLEVSLTLLKESFIVFIVQASLTVTTYVHCLWSKYFFMAQATHIGYPNQINVASHVMIPFIARHPVHIFTQIKQSRYVKFRWISASNVFLFNFRHLSYLSHTYLWSKKLLLSSTKTFFSGTAHFKKCKQSFEYQHLLLHRVIYLVVKVNNLYLNVVHFFNTSIN